MTEEHPLTELFRPRLANQAAGWEALAQPSTVKDFTASKSGYLVAITNEDLENAQVWPVKLLSPEEQAAQRAAARERSRAYVVGITARLATAHPALHPVIELHSCDQHGDCTGCDLGSYAEDGADWPCRTIELILEGL